MKRHLMGAAGAIALAACAAWGADRASATQLQLAASDGMGNPVPAASPGRMEDVGQGAGGHVTSGANTRDTSKIAPGMAGVPAGPGAGASAGEPGRGHGAEPGTGGTGGAGATGAAGPGAGGGAGTASH